jgi:hypothetical protein
MAYVKLDDQIAHHPKVLRAGAEAAWLWAVSIAYCNRQLTDGHVPAAALSTMGAFRTPTRKLAATLVSVGLFEVDGDGYQVHDYLSHNPDKATVQQRMRDAAQRTAASRARHGHAAVTPMSQRDIAVTGVSSRATRTDSDSDSIPHLTTAPKSGAVDALGRPMLVSFDDDYGAMPTRKRNPAMAWEGQREGLGVPDKLHRDLLSRLGTPDEAALLAWYAETERVWQGRAVGETCWQFWNARFTEWQGQTPTARRGHRPYGVGVAAPSSSVAVVDPDYNGAPYRFHCQHRPTCTTWPQHRDMDADTAVSA